MTDKPCEVKPKKELPSFSLKEGEVKGLKNLTIDQEVEFKMIAKVTSAERATWDDNKMWIRFNVTDIEMMPLEDKKAIEKIKSANNMNDLEQAEKEMEQEEE